MKSLISKLSFFLLNLVFSVTVVNASPVTLFQSDGTDSSIFNNLSTIGDVHFNTPLANIFGRDINQNPLSNAQRFDNDFFGTLADSEFLSASNGIKNSEGILFNLGNFNNLGAVDREYSASGINWQIAIPQGASDRRLHVQFGPGGNAAPGGGAGGAAGGGRKGALRQVLSGNTNVKGKKVWGQFINNAQIPVVNGNISGALAELKKQLSERDKFANNDAMLDAYLALADGTRFVDPFESFYIDLVNDTGSSFNLELEILFSNSDFSTLAQFLDNITVEIGDIPDFPEIYNDLANNTFLGAVPFSLDLNDQGNGQGGIPLVQINSVDVFDTTSTVPEPTTILLLFSGIVYFRIIKNKNS